MKKKLLLTLILAFVLTLLFAISVSAGQKILESWDISENYDESLMAYLYLNDDDYYSSNDVLYTLVISGNGTMRSWSRYDVPWDDYSYHIERVFFLGGVPNIGEYAFCDISIDSIIIPDTVTSIGYCAFYSSSIDSVFIPSSVTELNSSAFYNSTIYDTIYFEASEYDTQSIDGTYSISYEHSHEYIDCICECGKYLSSDVSVNSDKSVMAYIYAPDEYNPTNYEVAIVGFGEVKQVNFENFNLSSYAFDRFTIYEGITALGDNALYNIYYPWNTLELPESLERIGSNVFGMDIKSIKIGENVSEISSTAFTSATGLQQITVNPNNNYFFSADGVLYTREAQKSLVCYPAGKTQESFVLPSDVEYINDNAFNYCDLVSITLPKGLKSIGADAFRYSRNLTSIVIPGSVTSIGSYAFYNCTGLTSVEIKNGVKYIGGSAFTYCDSLTSIVFPNSLISIGNDAFYSCDKLTSVVIPNSVTTIGSHAFNNCESLKKVVLGKSLTSIGSSAFIGCLGLVEVYNLSSLNITKGSSDNGMVAAYALAVHTSLDEESKLYTTNDGLVFFYDGATCSLVGYTGEKVDVLTLPSDYNGCSYNINGNAFYACKNINKVIIPSGVTRIGNNAFCDSSLKSIVISDTVKYIDYGAFYECRNLKSIVIPKNVTNISSDVFVYCSGLCFYSYHTSKPSSWSSDWNDTDIFGGSTLVVTWGITDNGITDDGIEWVVKDGSVTIIGYSGNSTHVSIPAQINGLNVTAIGKNALNNSSILSVFVGNTVTTVDSYSFSNKTTVYSSLESKPDTWASSSPVVWNVTNCGVTDSGLSWRVDENGEIEIIGYMGNEAYVFIPSQINGINVTSIKNNAFSGNKSLSSVIIGDKVRTIGENAFQSCTSLSSIIIGNGITAIGNYTFDGCTSLSSILLPSSVTAIGNYAFRNCDALTSISFNNITSIGDCAFYDCDALTSISFNNITSIGGSAFYDCDALTSVTVPSSIVSVGTSAFAYCNNLTSATFNCNVPDYAFFGCDRLKSVVIGDSVTSVGKQAFYSCPSLISVVVGKSVNSFGSSAFYQSYPVLVYNLSSLNITKGSSSYGYLAYRALEVYTSLNDQSYIFEDGNGFVFHLKNDVCNLVKYTGTDTDIVLPNNYNGYSYGIYSYAFYDRDSLTSVVIGEGVTTIGDSAFSNCNRLASVVIPNSVTTIGNSAFWNCDSLTSVVIPNSVTTIGDSAFSSCTSLTSIVIGEGVTTIGDSAFSGCTSLTSIVIPSGVTTIGSNAFSSCTSLTSIVIPSGVTTIGSQAFYKCDSLKAVFIASNVTSIGQDAFFGCFNAYFFCQAESKPSGWFSDWDTHAKDVTWGADGVTQDCFIWELNDKNTVTILFYFGTETEVIIPRTINGVAVTGMSSYAFVDNKLITKIVIPIGISKMSSYGIDCPNATIYCEAQKKPTGWDYDWYNYYSAVVWGYNNITSNSDFDYIIVDGKAILTKYKGSSTNVTIPATIDGYTVTSFSSLLSSSKITSVTISQGITEISDYAFYSCSALTSVVIPNSVTTIGDYAFYYCSALTSVEIGNSVTTIGDYAFRNCDSLTSVVIGEGVTTIGDSAFMYCGSLTSVVIPNSVTTIGDSAFYNCDSLISVVIGEGVTTIGEDAFKYCYALTSVVIGEGVTTIGNNAFNACNKLVEVYDLSTSITVTKGSSNNGYLGYYALDVYTSQSTKSSISVTDDGFIFYSKGSTCYLLGNINKNSALTLPNSFNGYSYGIYKYAFYYCGSLTSVVIPSGVTTIDDYAFYGCGSLASVVIPNGVTTIGDYAFGSCDSLTSVVIPNGVTTIDGYAFYNCNSLISVVIPSSVTTISGYAFYSCDSLTSVVIPNSVTSIGYYAFYYCYNLTVYAEASSQPSKWSSYWINSSISSVEWGHTHQYEFTYTSDTHTSSCYCGMSVTESHTFENHMCQCGMEEPYVEMWDVSQGNDNSVIAKLYNDPTRNGYYILEIFGNGEMKNWSYISKAPWYSSYRTLLSSIVINDGISNVGSYAFYDCCAIESLTIGKDVLAIGDYSFTYCEAISALSINDGLIYIGASAFNGCSLQYLYIPESVTYIGGSAFYECEGLEIYVQAASKPRDWDANWNSWNCFVEWGHTHRASHSFVTSELTHTGTCDCGALEITDTHQFVNHKCLCGYAEKPVASWYNGKITLYKDTVNSGYYTLYLNYTLSYYDGCPWSSYAHNIKTVYIGNGCTEIPEFLFRSCGITDVTIDGSVKIIGFSSFSDCTSLKNLTIGEGVEIIDPYAFSGCSALENINLPSTLKDIYPAVFDECYNAVEAEDGIYYIGNWAVGIYNSNLATELNIRPGTVGVSLTALGSEGENNEYCVVNINLPSSVKYISTAAFANFYQLESINIPSGVSYIGYSPFSSSLLTIYVDLECEPDGWTPDWNSSNLPVVWKNPHNHVYSNRICAICGKKNFGVESGSVWDISASRDGSVIATLRDDPENPGYYILYITGNGEMQNWFLTNPWEYDMGSTLNKQITAIHIAEGVTSIGSSAFYGFDLVTTLVIPSSVTYIGYGIFEHCDSITAIYIPNSVSYIEDDIFISSNPNATIYTSLDTIPSSWANTGDTIVTSHAHTFEAHICVCGITSRDAHTYSNGVITKAPTHLTEGEMVLNCPCGATVTEVVEKTTEHIFGEWIRADKDTMTRECPCGVSEQSDVPSEIRLEDIFTFKGYSFNENGDIAVGFDIDYYAIEKYEELTGTTLEIGVVFAAFDLLNGREPLNSDGTTTELEDGMVVKFDITSYEYISYDFVLTDITENIYDIPLVISAYINDGQSTKYVQGNGVSDTVVGITYNEAKQ